MNERRRLWCQCCLPFQNLRNAVRWKHACRVVPLDQRRVTFRGREDWQLRQSHLWIRGHRLKQRCELIGDAGNSRTPNPAPPTNNADRDLCPGVHLHHNRIIRAEQMARRLQPQSGSGWRRTLPCCNFKNKNRIEQRTGSARSFPLLDLGERRVLERLNPRVFRPNVPKQPGDILPWQELDPEWRRVDQVADHLLDTRDRPCPPRYGKPKQDVLLAAVLSQ